MTTETKTRVQSKQRLQEPKKWKVLFLNDDYTPMDFVTKVLVDIFKHTTDSATNIMLTVHKEGSAVAGEYSFEIAEVKSVETTSLARSNGYPLQIKLIES